MDYGFCRPQLAALLNIKECASENCFSTRMKGVGESQMQLKVNIDKVLCVGEYLEEEINMGTRK